MPLTPVTQARSAKPPHVRSTVVPPPPIQPIAGKVGLVDPVGFALAHASQPTTQDLLNAINDLSKKISQLSKNQQTLASSLDQIGKTVTANYLNIQKAANYINGPTAWYAYWVVGHPFPESDTPLAGWANP